MLLTLLVRGAMFPISRKSAMLSQKMQALAPEIKKLQEKYKNDPQAKTAEVMALYRKHGVNPFGSCLPMVMQMPFFLGLYYCLQESINFRLAGFLWIDNLAAPDMLIHWGSGIPIISDPDNMTGSLFSFLFLGPYFNILPVVAVTLMLLQQKMMTPPPADEQQEMQQKMMKYMMVFMGIMFYKVAAGLCIYFVVSSLWGLAERKMLPKKPPGLGMLAGAPTSSGTSPNGGKPNRGRANEARQARKETRRRLSKGQGHVGRDTKASRKEIAACGLASSPRSGDTVMIEKSAAKSKKRAPKKSVKIIVEKHSDGYVAYPLGLKGVVVGQGDSYEEAVVDVKSAIRFHIATFGKAVLEGETSVLEAFVAEAEVAA